MPFPSPTYRWCPSLDSVGSGTDTLHELQENGNDGSLTNMDPANDWVDDDGKEALDLDGTNDQVDVASVPAMPVVSLWVKNHATTLTYQRAFSWGINQCSLRFNYMGVQLRLESLFWANVRSSMVVNLSSNQWHHLLVQREDGDGKVHLYVDTVDVFSVTKSALSGTQTLSIGSSSLSHWWDGRFDDFQVFPSALDSSQRSDLYSAGRGGSPVGSRSYSLGDGDRGRWQEFFNRCM